MQTPRIDGDRRTVSRRRVLQSGKLVYGGSFTVDCAVRDRSETGVRLRASQDLLPREVVLVSVTEGKAYPGEIVWRDGEQAGLKLKEPQDLTGAVAKSYRHARAVWAENAMRDYHMESDTAVLGESLD